MITRLIFTTLLLTCCCYCLPFGPREKRQVVNEEGLYGGDTNVISLNITTFNSIYGTRNAWFVEFYASWCGHCQRFAPLWKDLAQDIQGWKDVIKIAAIDCASAVNSQQCADYGVTSYPTVKFFPADSDVNYKGEEMTKGKSVEELRKNIARTLIREQLEGRGNDWPQITQFSTDKRSVLWKDVPSSVKYQLVIYEDENSYLGAELILDLHKINKIRVRRINNDPALSNLEEEGTQNVTAPNIFVFERNEDPQQLHTSGSSRDEFIATIRMFLESKNIFIPTTTSSSQTSSTEMSNAQTQYRTDLVYQVDLENALRYSLKTEIPTHGQIKGETLKALKNYLKVLAKHFPTTFNGLSFLEQLRDWVLSKNEITGTQFLNSVAELEDENKPVFQSDVEWLGCKGSTPKYRGYPCGLWTLFHSLTTNAVLQNRLRNDENFNNLEVLNTMVGYIKHFFGCEECSMHFQKMANESLRSNVSQPNDGILWLWRAHNKANKRLAGDATEDPAHPKVQFPSAESCPGCRDDSGHWIENEVLLFLEQVYTKFNIMYTRWKGKVDSEIYYRQFSERMPTAESLASSCPTFPTPFMTLAIALITLKRLLFS